tara:strand:- start:188 stop:1411 length:1224 start_codon:yes stop_codon:yes gene_type:complete
MAKLTGQSIASSYDQLLIVTGADGVTSSLQAVESADTGGAVASLQISTVGAAIDNPTASSATQGGKLTLFSDDGAALGDTHRLGVLEFSAAEDTGSTLTVGASIDAFADGAWDADSAGTFLKFSTTPTGNSVSLTERMRINSVGNIGVGVVPKEWYELYDGLQIGNSGSIAGYSGANVDRIWVSANAYHHPDGEWKRIQADTASQHEQRDGVHNFFTSGTGSADTDITWTKNMGIAASGDVTVSTGNLVIGTAGKGISFAATSDASGMTSELLDDYEEGVWTPIVKDYGDPLVAFTAGTGNSGTYTKVGRMVTCNAFVTTSADNSASGSIAIHGLPFAQVSGSDTAVTFGNYEQLAITAETSINGTIYDTNQFIGLYVADGAGGSTNMSVAEWSPDGRTYLSVTYFV